MMGGFDERYRPLPRPTREQRRTWRRRRRRKTRTTIIDGPKLSAASKREIDELFRDLGGESGAAGE